MSRGKDDHRNTDPLASAVRRGEELFIPWGEAFDIDSIEPECNRGPPLDALKCHKRLLAS
jgi:hypothetical protein